MFDIAVSEHPLPLLTRHCFPIRFESRNDFRHPGFPVIFRGEGNFGRIGEHMRSHGYRSRHGVLVIFDTALVPVEGIVHERGYAHV